MESFLDDLSRQAILEVIAEQYKNRSIDEIEKDLNRWIEEGKNIQLELTSADDGSCRVNDMLDTIINGLGLIDYK